MKIVAFALVGLIMLPAAAPSPARVGGEDPCRATTFDGSRITVCTARPLEDDLSLVTSGQDGRPVRSFARLASRWRGRAIAFAVNAGMFDVDGRPIGLSVVDGVEQTPLNRRSGAGNFYLKPNGVFFGDAAGWHLATTEDFAVARHRPLRFATQSGPMLLVGGIINPHFADNGSSRKIRNGVGLGPGGSAVFAISDEPVSFGAFARLFRDRLGCRDALYLDGHVSSLWDPISGRRDEGAPLGPLLVASARPDRHSQR